METDFGIRQTDELNSYIWNQLSALDTHLPKDVFFRVLKTIYRHISQSFLNVLEVEIQKKRQPNCFRQWKELWSIVDNSFQHDDTEEDDILTKIHLLLTLHGMDTSELIHLYRLERMAQLCNTDSSLGQLTVRAIFVDDALNIDVLNARNLKSTDSDGKADPYVKVQILPIHHFPDAAILKSKVHKNTLFPLFDESFT